jgi:hypothetical protein
MRLPRLVHNPLTYAGAGIAALASAGFVFLFLFHTFTEAARAPYAGLVIFIVLPAVLLFGLALIPVGMLLEWRRWHREGERRLPRFPVVDLNNPRHLNATLVFVVGSVLLLFLSAFGSYQAYVYTESVEFCGTLCHTVMRPEYATYSHSPHQRVACVECHVGPGADWFVRSKLSGLGQVAAVLLDTFPRPIPTPIESLRPSRETCEHCHWPEQFFGGKQRRQVHFLSDERNTRWEIDLLVKIGGGHPAVGLTEGIHWHMSLANVIEYVPADDRRQEIPWVRVTERRTGRTRTYVSRDTPPSPELLATTRPRVMDCIDCHNRPTHIFRPPSRAVDHALAAGLIDPALPFIKRTGVEVLAEQYPSTPEALAAIERRVRSFYEDEYPDVARTRPAEIAGAIAALQEIFAANMFPEMNARWDVYPDNAGHLVSPGCARCHGGQHVSEDGRVVTTECRECHTILAQGSPPNVAYATAKRGLDFQHPVDVGDVTEGLACSACHTGETP